MCPLDFYSACAPGAVRGWTTLRLNEFVGDVIVGRKKSLVAIAETPKACSATGSSVFCFGKPGGLAPRVLKLWGGVSLRRHQ